uniref:DUF1084 domain-containing protein n=1 Tax=Heterorhabditis bacteriophora TaxID=37862 RepID=A0A1I7X357_HETBA
MEEFLLPSYLFGATALVWGWATSFEPFRFFHSIANREVRWDLNSTASRVGKSPTETRFRGPPDPQAQGRQLLVEAIQHPNALLPLTVVYIMLLNYYVVPKVIKLHF